MTLIDKIAWIRLEEDKVLSTRLTCYSADYQGTLTPSSEVDELIWLTYADRSRVSPVDQVIFGHLHGSGQLM
jgi:hypothetical protein